MNNSFSIFIISSKNKKLEKEIWDVDSFSENSNLLSHFNINTIVLWNKRSLHIECHTYIDNKSYSSSYTKPIEWNGSIENILDYPDIAEYSVLYNQICPKTNDFFVYINSNVRWYRLIIKQSYVQITQKKT